MNPARVRKVKLSSEGCSYGYQEQAQKFMNISKNIRGSCDLNKSSEKYI